MKRGLVSFLMIVVLSGLFGAMTVAQDLVSTDIASLMSLIREDRLRSHVETLQGFGTRHVNSAINDPEFGIGAARNYIYEQFEDIAANSSLSFQVQFQEFDMSYNGVYTHQKNVVAMMAGTESNSGYLVIGAHYDSINTDFTDARGFAPAANDNATGVAALIEISRVMSQSQHYYGIIFVALSAEELNRVGSIAFVRWAEENQINIVGMINIDSVGNSYNASTGERDESLRIFSCETEHFCADSGRSRQMARSIQLISAAKALPLELNLIEQADRNGRYGDHFSFAERGHPAIRFINSLEEWGNGSTMDLVDFIEWDYLQKASQTILVTAIALAEAPAPSHLALQSNASGEALLVWDAVLGAEAYVIVLRAANSTVYDTANLIFIENTDIALPSHLLDSGQWVAVAIACRSQSGLVGWLSQEYSLA